MKRFLAYAGSALFPPLVLLPLVEINLRFVHLWALPLYCVFFPLAIALYFLIAGRLFESRFDRRHSYFSESVLYGDLYPESTRRKRSGRPWPFLFWV